MRSASTMVLKAMRASALEYVVLFGLWMLFVSSIKLQEVVVGFFAALVAVIANGALKSAKFAKFKPRLEWLPLVFWEAWYAVSGTWSVICSLARALAGKKSKAEFVSIPMSTGGNDAEGWARRALLIAYMTMTPDFIVLGIDTETRCILAHVLAPTGVPLIAQRLGAKRDGVEEVPQA